MQRLHPGAIDLNSIIASALAIFLSDEFKRAVREVGEAAAEKQFEQKAIEVSADLQQFLIGRLKVILQAEGKRHDVVDACFNASAQDDIGLFCIRAEALNDFLSTEDGKNLLAGTKRAANILRIEEKKDGTTYAAAVNASLLSAPEEKALATAIDAAMPRIEAAIASEDFAAAMTALAALRAPVDAFFDKVKVNDDDKQVRANRLNLLARIKQAAGLVADFSKIEG